MSTASLPARRVRMAMIGGGPGSFVGPIHRLAAALDGRIELVAGAFSRDPEKSRATALACGLAPERAHADHRALLAGEAGRADGAEFVVIVTPNDAHFPAARDALAQGFAVLSDKPATATLDEARALRELVQRSGRLYGLTYTYTGYPMLREARTLCANGTLGRIRKIVVEYSQGWLSTALEAQGDRQAGWRLDPAQAGPGGSIGDIGVHAFNIAEFVSGRRVNALCADLGSVVPGRALDDDCNILLRFDDEVRGLLVASQIAAGDRNSLRLRVYGERGGLDWSHETPNLLTVNRLDAPTELRHAGAAYLGEDSRRVTRTPVGHPEGFIEAFANLYLDFAAALRAGRSDPGLVPSIDEGLRGMAFVAVAVESSRQRAWLPLQV